jgi:hypothetical protein
MGSLIGLGFVSKIHFPGRADYMGTSFWILSRDAGHEYHVIAMAASRIRISGGVGLLPLALSVRESINFLPASRRALFHELA